jgi:dihydroxyacetone kinase
MLDALVPLVDSFAEGATLAKAVEAARHGMEATKKMKPKFGRATYVGNVENAETADAGAYGVFSILEGILLALDGASV